ncbi:MAG: cation transporter [Rhizobiales bacterium]|nr:cation transporter [Hyphomicrobiales bacterium]
MTHDHTRGAAAVRDLGSAFKWAVILNLGYVLIEAAAGFVVGSLALLADAAHNLTDVAGLLIAWGAAVAARKPPTDRFTYGLGRSTILAALANAIAILVGVGAVIWESIHRFSDPVAVPALPVLVVAVVGIAINAGTALLFRRDRHDDLNAEGAFLHMAADAAVSAGVVLSAGAMLATGWLWLDPLAAILVSFVIAWTAFGLLKASIGLSMDGVPRSVDKQAVDEWLRSRPGVTTVHDLHIWSLSTTSTALTAHLVMPSGHPGDVFLDQLADEIEDHFGIAHATLQIETGGNAECRLAQAGVI